MVDRYHANEKVYVILLWYASIVFYKNARHAFRHENWPASWQFQPPVSRSELFKPFSLSCGILPVSFVYTFQQFIIGRRRQKQPVARHRIKPPDHVVIR